MYKAVIGYTAGLVTLALYVIFTASFIKPLLTTPLFSKPAKRFHLIMIWVVPFIWLVLLKAIMKSAPGSHKAKRKESPEPFFDAYKID